MMQKEPAQRRHGKDTAPSFRPPGFVVITDIPTAVPDFYCSPAARERDEVYRLPRR